MQESLKKGIEQGIEQGVLQVARQMKRAGFSVQDLTCCTGLSEEEIVALG